MIAFALPISGDDVPSSYREIVKSSKILKWKTTMDEEMKSLQKNKTWKLAQLLKGNKVIRCKWVYVKNDRFLDKNGVCHKARLVAIVNGVCYSQCLRLQRNMVVSCVVLLEGCPYKLHGGC